MRPCVGDVRLDFVFVMKCLKRAAFTLLSMHNYSKVPPVKVILRASDFNFPLLGFY